MDDLYRFIHTWVPTLYGELDEDYWRKRNYVLLDTETDLAPELSAHEAGEGGESTEEGKARNHEGDEISDLTRESWEVSAPLPFLRFDYCITVGPSNLSDFHSSIDSFTIITLNCSTLSYRVCSPFEEELVLSE